MSDTSDEFRNGFLLGLADRGITPIEFGAALIKRAQQEKQASILGSLGQLGDFGLATAVGAPLVLGSAAGYGIAKATAPQYNTSVDDIHKDELMRQLRMQTRRINRRLGPPPVTPDANAESAQLTPPVP